MHAYMHDVFLWNLFSVAWHNILASLRGGAHADGCHKKVIWYITISRSLGHSIPLAPFVNSLFWNSQAHTQPHAHAHTNKHARTQASTHTQKRTYTHTQTQCQAHAHKHTHTHMHTHKGTRTHCDTNTHTHTGGSYSLNRDIRLL